MTAQRNFEDFLAGFMPRVEDLTLRRNSAVWELETTGSPEAAQRQAELQTQLRLLHSDRQVFEQLLVCLF